MWVLPTVTVANWPLQISALIIIELVISINLNPEVIHQIFHDIDLIFAEFAIPPFHSTIPVHCSSPVIVDYPVFLSMRVTVRVWPRETKLVTGYLAPSFIPIEIYINIYIQVSPSPDGMRCHNGSSTVLMRQAGACYATKAMPI